MQYFFFAIALGLVVSGSATLSGPFLFWGHEKVITLQPRALVEANEEDFTDLFKEAKAIVVFVRNTTERLNGDKYPKFQLLVKNNGWAYLPQRSLLVEPFNYNTNIEVINLSGSVEEEDSELINGFNEAITIYGEGEVLGILANRDDDLHFIAKRAAKDKDEEDMRTSTVPTPVVEETEKDFIYVAEGKALLYLTATPIINIADKLNWTKLMEHHKAITFDDQKSKGYGRFNIIFSVEGEKLFLRFNFTLVKGTWSMKAVEVEYKEYKSVLPVVGGQYDIPSAPVGFSYRCSAYQLVFRNENDSLLLNDYQVQPWLNGTSKFSDAYNCIGFTTAPIWAGILVSLFLCGILSIGILALMDIKTPNRFETSRSKQLSFYVQE